MQLKQSLQRFAGSLTVLGLLAAPASAATVTFQQGVDGYSSARDTMLSETFASLNFGANENCGMDLCCGTGGTLQGLVGFDDIFGAGAGQIPLGSTILSATLTIVVFNEDVEGPAAMHEVLQSWDEFAVTWNSVVGGMSIDDVEAKSAAAVTVPGGFNPLGTHVVDVTSSLANWSAGQENHGWLFRQDNTDGTEFRSSNYSVMAERPLLTVTFTPAQATFQQDVDGYTGTRDTMLSATFATTNFGANTNCGMDLCCGTGGTLQGLVRFADIFGAGPGQIPLGSTIDSASLTIEVFNEDLDGPAALHEVLQDWDEFAITWNSAGGGMSTDDVEAKSAATVTIAGGLNPLGTHVLDVTSSLANWSGGQANFGWLFRQDSTDGTEFRSSNYATVSERPVLVVNYTPASACPADLGGDGEVGFADVLAIIAAWGTCGAPCPADLNGDGSVGFADILIAIAAWGPC